MESNDKAWLWAALDFAESNKGTYEKFCLRFKTKDVGLEFKQAVDDAVDQLDGQGDGGNGDVTDEDVDDEEDAYEDEEGEEAAEEDKPESEKDQDPKQESFAATLTSETDKKEAPAATSIFGSATTLKPLSFADLLNSNSDSSPNSGFKCDPSYKFPGAGPSVFKSPAAAVAPEKTASIASTVDSKAEDEADSAGANEAEEYEPEVDFKPVVPLPDLVDVKTGEEEEEVLYKHRAKLFRYSAETKEFKERGLGDIKILKHKASGKVRVILRREQILKLACNFNLTLGIELKPMSTSDKAFQWICMDFSEGELTQEGLAVKFKSADIAAGFKQAWNDAVACLEKGEEKKTPTPAPVLDTNKAGGFKACEGAAKAFGSMFKPKAGSWECMGCMTRNGPDVANCPCCNTANPSKSAAEPKPAAVAPAATGFGDAFKPKTGSWECGGCYTRNGGDINICPCCNTPNPNAPAEASASAAPPSLASKLGVASVSGGFTFGGSPASSSFSFGTKTPLATSTPAFGTSVPLGTGSGTPSSTGFTFGTPSTSASSAPVFCTGPIKFGTSASLAETKISESPKLSSTPVFGTPSSTGSTFGKLATPAPSDPATPVKPIFGIAATTTVTATPPYKEVPSIFGGTAKSPPSTFVIGGDKSDAPKPAFNLGGFTFGSTPVVKTSEEVAEEKKKEETKKSEEKEAVPQTGLFTAFKGFGNAAATTASPVTFSSIFTTTASDDDKKEAENAPTTTAATIAETSAPITTSSWAPPSTVFSFATNKSLFSLGRSNSQSSLVDSDCETEEGKATRQ